ncbi:hypothetical protein SCAR479_11794 [Seiridium cardinale]|uniref:Uncharacterized protein n=1 Tax=Seiridium cardinale TaxID=138064 RepID=A0ABR2XCZ5_9PEZI
MRLTNLLPTFISTAFRLSEAATPNPPGFTYLFTANVTLEPAINMGVGPYGQRVAIPIIGGTFTFSPLARLSFLPSMASRGSKADKNAKGTILNLGADWGWTDTHNPSGVSTFHPDTRYQLRTSDGANIFIQTEGPAQTDGTIHLREKFETGSADYYWMNNIVAVGILKAGSGSVM